MCAYSHCVTVYIVDWTCCSQDWTWDLHRTVKESCPINSFLYLMINVFVKLTLQVNGYCWTGYDTTMDQMETFSSLKIEDSNFLPSSWREENLSQLTQQSQCLSTNCGDYKLWSVCCNIKNWFVYSHSIQSFIKGCIAMNVYVHLERSRMILDQCRCVSVNQVYLNYIWLPLIIYMVVSKMLSVQQHL